MYLLPTNKAEIHLMKKLHKAIIIHKHKVAIIQKFRKVTVIQAFQMLLL